MSIVRRAAAAGATIALLAGISVVAQGRGSADASFAGKKVSIDYGRPELRGRDATTLLPAGRVWRFGMNQATTITSEANLAFDGVEVPKGAYSLFAKKVSDDKWHLIVNKQTGQWGTNYDASQNLVEIPLAAKTGSESVEQFTIDLKANGNQGEMTVSWGTLRLQGSFRAE